MTILEAATKQVSWVMKYRVTLPVTNTLRQKNQNGLGMGLTTSNVTPMIKCYHYTSSTRLLEVSYYVSYITTDANECLADGAFRDWSEYL